MKKVLLFLFVTLSINAFADRIIYKDHGQVNLLDGKELKGIVRYSPMWPSYLEIQEVDSPDFRKVKFKEIKTFIIGDQKWLKKDVKGVVGFNDDYFLQQLSPDTQKIKLFKYEQQNPNTYEMEEETYYVLLPNQENVISIGDMKLLPFNKKFPKYIEDCPTLAKKIEKKENGYAIKMISSDISKLKVYMKVSEEYQNCK